MTITTADRDAEMLRLRIAGATYAAIGAAYGISTTRARAVILRLVDKATTDEATREVARFEAKAQREERRRAFREEQERRRAEAARLALAGEFAEKVAGLAPRWQELNDFCYWVNRPGPTSVRDPNHRPYKAWQYVSAQGFMDAWLDGRANDHMTLLRLRTIAELDA